VLRLGRRGAQLRPFCLSAGVRNRGYSQRLQRVMVDFGAEHSFAKAAERIQEHYRIAVPVETIRQHTLHHGRHISQIPAQSADAAKTLVAQMDGTMIPVVQSGNGPDARKDKQLFWREARLCPAIMVVVSRCTRGLMANSQAAVAAAGGLVSVCSARGTICTGL